MPVPGKDATSRLARGMRGVLRNLGLLRELVRREKRATLNASLLPSKVGEAASWLRRHALDGSTTAPTPDFKPDAAGSGKLSSKGQGDQARVAASNPDHDEDQLGTPQVSWLTPERKREIRRLEKELSRRKEERALFSHKLDATRREGSSSEFQERVKQIKSIRQEVFHLQNRIDVMRKEAKGETGVGALPDFAIIGAPKCGTTFLYHLLAKHPLVSPAAFKEVHYFDLLYDKGEQWYRQCFPSPRHKDGRKAITGEATPGYLAHPQAPERMAEIVPQAKLIALLRNPVDRVYSGYHFFRSRRGQDTHKFDKHVQAALGNPSRSNLLPQGIYVDQLAAWSEFFAREQILVLKSEGFFEEPRRTLNVVLDFLELPAWDPDASELGQKRNKGPYEGEMEQETRRKLEEYYEPHNQRLYEHLGENFGW